MSTRVYYYQIVQEFTAFRKTKAGNDLEHLIADRADDFARDAFTYKFLFHTATKDNRSDFGVFIDIADMLYVPSQDRLEE